MIGFFWPIGIFNGRYKEKTMSEYENASESDENEYEDFKPTKKSIEGFWRPENTGETIEILIGDFVNLGKNRDGKDNTFLAGILMVEGANIAIKDPKTNEEQFITGHKGQSIGVSSWAELRGLADFKGHSAKITFLGKVREKKNGRSFEKNKVTVKVSKFPVDKDSVPF
jgi:hypothetical protein